VRIVEKSMANVKDRRRIKDPIGQKYFYTSINNFNRSKVISNNLFSVFPSTIYYFHLWLVSNEKSNSKFNERFIISAFKFSMWDGDRSKCFFTV